ncbi:MAG: glucosaminidase domain-containing protein [Bacteroidaceae bacterium]|nr:glucosaminidase domain-containing protein [Bacteroidaceae bacterium]
MNLMYNLRRFLTLIILWGAGLVVLAQSTNQAYWSYIDKYKNMAIEQMRKYRIPASITLAQGLLESAAGRSTLATEANNHFGIKCGGSWNGPYVLRNDDAPNEKFRKYKNAAESYEDHSRFLQGRRYQGLFKLSINDYKGWARGLKQAGYATNPAYAESLIRIIEMYNLHQFDTGKLSRNQSAVKTPKDDFFACHTVYKNNKNYFIIVEIGDNMATISHETGVSLKHLYSYNDLPKDYAPTQGDVIYLQKKRKEASREFRKNPIHIVEPNQSMFDIAQLYGIRLEYLYKLNHVGPDYAPQVGDILRIR